MMNSFMNWRMFADVDNLDGNDRLYNKFLDIYVLHPRTHIKDGKALYTDYEICVKTNHPEFAIKESKVRRRYSEFVWLKNRLGINDIMMVTAPSLPAKRFIGRFKDSFLIERQMGLQHFMNKVVEVNAFLTDPALHVFLQSELPVADMEYYLHQSGHLSNIRDRIIAMQKLRDKREMKRRKNEERSCARKGTLKRNLSSDTLMTSMKEPSKPMKVFSGRGWSRFLGDGDHKLSVQSGADVTDSSCPAGSHVVASGPRNGKATARVLPGGQLCLAESDDDRSNLDARSALSRRRANSWHGTTSDVVDLWLEEYDIIGKNSNDMVLGREASLSSASDIKNRDSRSCSGGSDELDVVELSKRLSEYNVIALPKERPELFIHSGKSE